MASAVAGLDLGSVHRLGRLLRLQGEKLEAAAQTLQFQASRDCCDSVTGLARDHLDAILEQTLPLADEITIACDSVGGDS